MKIIILFFQLSITATCFADIMHLPINCVFSEVQSNVFIAFSTSDGTDNFSLDKKIEYGFGSQDFYRHILALDDKYGCMISAKFESGQEVQKTRAGKKFGEMFLNVTNFNLEQLDFNKTRGTGGYKHPYLSIAESDGVVFSRDLPPLQELLIFDKPGKYVVSVQLQCFVGPYGESNATNVHLIKFAPVKLQVIKKEDAKGK